MIDASTGEARTTQLFVAVLGASNYTYAEASWTQGLSDWIGSHTRSFAFFGGVPAMVVCDYVPGHILQSVFSLAARRRVSPEERKGQGIATVS